MREKEIKVLEVKPYEYSKEFILENSLETIQEAVGGLIDYTKIAILCSNNMIY